MSYDNDFISAIKKKISTAGNQKKYAGQIGIAQSRISEYLNRKITLDGISFGMLRRLFPGLKVSFCEEDKESAKVPSEPKPMEDELVALFRRLNPQEQARCLLIVGAHFSNIIKER